ncbi:MAG: hypothetical protein JW941_11100 [Candidatus Coatesbacteria bacterium]|nr:hypothetical protein [Candidatus Coatesbacteria bacterium]
MKSEKLVSMSENSDGFLKDILKGEAAFPTFSNELNMILSGGLLPGKLYTIEGPPDGTKSSFAIQLIDRLAQDDGIPSLFISSTLSKREIYIQSIARLSRVHSGEIEARAWQLKEWAELHGRDAVTRVKSRIKDGDESYRSFSDKIFTVEIPAEGGMHVSEVRRYLNDAREQLKAARDLVDLPSMVVVIDTLRGLRYASETKSGEPSQEDVVNMLKELRMLAHTTGCAIVALVDGAAFGRLYQRLGMLPSALGHELGSTAYYADTTMLMETDDTLLSDAIQELYDRGMDRDAAKLEEARSRFPLANPKISPFLPTYARLMMSTRGTGAVRNVYFIFLKAIGDFRDLAAKRDVMKVYE